jgi:hypothetical protein
MAQNNDSMMEKAKDMAEEGVDILQNTGDVIGDATKKAVKSVAQGASNLSNAVTGNKNK